MVEWFPYFLLGPERLLVLIASLTLVCFILAVFFVGFRQTDL